MTVFLCLERSNSLSTSISPHLFYTRSKMKSQKTIKSLLDVPTSIWDYIDGFKLTINDSGSLSEVVWRLLILFHFYGDISLAIYSLL